MATTDNKVLTGAGVEQLSQLVKSAIAQGGGGTEYSAGSGINIDSNNVISNKFYPEGSDLLHALILKKYSPSMAIYTQASTREDFINKILAGKLVLLSTELSNFTSQELDIDTGNQRILTINFADGTASSQWWFSGKTLPASTYMYFKAGDMLCRFPYTDDFNIWNMLYRPAGSNFTATSIGLQIDELAAKETPVATTETPGTVIPDGTTITIDSNGVISSQGGGSSSLPSDPVVDGSYKLVNTVATVEGTQTATQSWEEDNGGASYTAGAGVEIDSNNVIMLKKALQRFDGVESLENVDLVGVPSLNYYNNPTTDQINAFAADVVRLGGGYIFTVSMNSTKMNTLQAAFQNALGLSYTPRIAINDSTNHDGLNINPNSPQRVPNNNTRFYIKPIYNGWTGLMACSWVESGKPVGNMGMNFDRYSVSDLKTYFEATVDTTPYGSYWLASDLISRAIQHTNFSSLSSTDTAPTVNNTINWVYK